MNFLSKYVWTFLNTISLLAMVWVNYLANSVPIGGHTTGELSAMYPNLFVPAGITFAVWGIIYLSLFVFVAYEWYGIWQGRGHKTEMTRRIGPLFLLSCGLNIGWIYSWHQQMVLASVVLMVILLIILLIIYTRVNSYSPDFRKAEQFTVLLPFSIYTSWITIALIANITALLVNMDWQGWGISPVLWTNIMVVIGAIISVLMVYRYGDIFFGAVTIWALLGIVLKRSGFPFDEMASIIIVSLIAIVVVSSTVTAVVYKKRIYHRYKLPA